MGAGQVEGWNAFQHLSSARSGGLAGPAPIPISEVLAYCVLVGINDPDDREDLMGQIRALDLEYLEWAASDDRRDNRDQS